MFLKILPSCNYLFNHW